MRHTGGWRGKLPTIPSAGGRVALVLLGALLAAVLVALLATLLGWLAVFAVVVALLAGIALGTSDALDVLDGAASRSRASPADGGPEAGGARPAGGRPDAPTGTPTEASTSAPTTTPHGSPPSAPVQRDVPGGIRPDARTARDGEPAGMRGDFATAVVSPHEPLPEAGIEEILVLLAERLEASRAVVWLREPAEGDLEPRLSTGRLPPPLSPRGQPLLWALEQDQPMRLDEPPVWADGAVLAVPFRLGDERALLTVERAGPATTGADPETELAEARRAAAILGRVLELAQRERSAAVARTRFESMIEFLRDVPGDVGRQNFAEGLAEAALAVTGGIGAAVASWEGESGQVLASRGVGGGPVAGTWFGVMEGDFAMAARAGSTLYRDRREGRPLPLAEPGERWTARPRYTGVVPLRDAAGDTSGLVAVWGDRPLAHDGLDLLLALGPLLALQLHHSTHLARFRQRATEDALTSLANRGALEERVDMERKRFHRYRRPVAILVIDLDHFKRINDSFGHPAGDAVLARVSDILRAETREADFPARYGGEELVVLMEETMRREAGEMAERIRAAIAGTTFEWNGAVIPVTASIGVSACPECVDDPGELMRSADEALYASKEGGRNRVTVAPISASGG